MDEVGLARVAGGYQDCLGGPEVIDLLLASGWGSLASFLAAGFVDELVGRCFGLWSALLFEKEKKRYYTSLYSYMGFLCSRFNTIGVYFQGTLSSNC